MTAVMLASCAAIGFVSPLTTTMLCASLPTAPKAAEMPLLAPPGWTTDVEDGATILTPDGVAEGKFYKVLATPLQGKAGSLDVILEEGRKMVAEIGTFTAQTEPQRSESAGGWGYQFQVGTIETADRAILSLLMAVKKADAGLVVVVLADSVETMGTYSDPLATMVRGMGAPQAAPTSATTVGADLRYTVPAGWTESQVEGLPLLIKAKDEPWVKYRVSLLVFPSEALTSGVAEQFREYWKLYIQPNYTTTVAPLPLMTRLGSGYACAFDADTRAKDKAGGEATVVLYMIAHGGRAVPVMGLFSGPNWSFDKESEDEIGQFLNSARLPGASEARVPLFNAADLAGEWSESSSEYADYVTSSGGYAGDASIATGTYLNLAADGTSTRTAMAITSDRHIKEQNAGTWSVDDDALVLSHGGRYSLLGYGAEPKVGRFLVLGNYADTVARLRLTNPRGILQAQWMRAQ